MTNYSFLSPFNPPARTGREGHVRLTYFGQWAEVEPLCCREAVDNLYSAPGEKGGPGRVPSCGLSLWAAEGAGEGLRPERKSREETCLLAFLLPQRWVGFLN